MKLSIVIAVNKRDLWFCRICIASIRYYYPDIPIYLLKDELNGGFSTREIETHWKVQVYNLSGKKFGWGASKTFFLLHAPENEKFLILDSDIIFIGPFLERLKDVIQNNDIVISADYMPDPHLAWVKNIYFDVKKLQAHDAEYMYPGYFFNTGQMIITGGKIRNSDFRGYFSRDYPYWLRKDLLPLVDQSLYNYIFPKLEASGKISIGKDHFMIWSESQQAKNITLSDVQEGNIQSGLIHWAGALRSPSLKKMSGSDLLTFFENYYYHNIPFSFIKRRIRIVMYKFLMVGLKIKSRIHGSLS
ncbi:MAG: hypothetical protein ACK4E8_06550 [Lacibacter sp.]